MHKYRSSNPAEDPDSPAMEAPREKRQEGNEETDEVEDDTETVPHVLKMPRDDGSPINPLVTQTTDQGRQTRVCVFCSTTPGIGDAHLRAARSLAQALHDKGIQLVYGGGTTGLMGELAKQAVKLSGPNNVHGIISSDILTFERPEAAVHGARSISTNDAVAKKSWRQKLGLGNSEPVKQAKQDRPPNSALLSEEIYGQTTITTDLPARKKLMCQQVHEGGLGSGFIALSGGFGTMDEVMEMVTLRQYGIHQARICLLNIEGFWDPLLTWMNLAIDKGFVREEARNMLAVKATPEDCIAWLEEG